MAQDSYITQKQDVSVSQKPPKQIKNFVITKKIAKHGQQSIIVIPSILREHLRPKMLVKIKIDVLKEEE